jgi:glycosyltransferase involved in cell wall biosynthesis
MEKLRVVVFNTQPPHLYFGGVERRIMEIGKRLSDEVNFTVYSGTKAGFYTPATVEGVKIVPCSSTDRLFPIDNWTFNRTLKKMAPRFQADVYESHNVSGYGLQKTLQTRNAKMPFITTVHGVLADEYTQAQRRGGASARVRLANFFMKQLAKIEGESARNASLVVTISRYSKQKIVELYGVDEAKIRIVPNGVDPQKFKPISDCAAIRELIGAGNRSIVLFVGRLIPRKGLHYLVEAARRVVREHNETLFVIVGDGPLKSQIVSEVTQAGLARNFAFLGDVAETELPTLYGCADIFAFPSIQEGQGIVLLEAQAAALPVVAFNVSGVTEAVLDKQTGLLVDPDSGNLAEAIIALLLDAALQRSLGAKGREHVLQELTWDICAKKMISVYQEATQLK